MKKRRNPRTLLFPYLLLALAALPGSIGLAAPTEVVQAARDGLAPFLEGIPPADRAGYGLEPEDRVEDADLGEPFQLYAVDPRALLAAGEETTVGEIVSPTETWFFPVEIDGQPRNILTVTRMNGAWEAVALGKAPLARELGAVRRRWVPAGYQPRLVAVYQAAAYFFTLPELDDYNFTPLNFSGRGFAPDLKTGPGYPDTTELDQILNKLQADVAENLRTQDF